MTTKKEKLADQELSLKEKYQILREQKNTVGSTNNGLQQKEQENQREKEKADALAKLEAAKKIFQASSTTVQAPTSDKSTGFKRPLRKKPSNPSDSSPSSEFQSYSSPSYASHNSSVENGNNDNKSENLAGLEGNEKIGHKRHKSLQSSFDDVDNGSPSLHYHNSPNVNSPSNSHSSPDAFNDSPHQNEGGHRPTGSPHRPSPHYSNHRSSPRDQQFSHHPPAHHQKHRQWDERDDVDFLPSTIFVGDLGDFADEHELHSTFSRFGPIENIRLIAGKNFCFVKFVEVGSAQAAIHNMQGEMLGGGRIRVAIARNPNSRNYNPNYRRDVASGGGAPQYHSGGPGGYSPQPPTGPWTEPGHEPVGSPYERTRGYYPPPGSGGDRRANGEYHHHQQRSPQQYEHLPPQGGHHPPGNRPYYNNKERSPGGRTNYPMEGPHSSPNPPQVSAVPPVVEEIIREREVTTYEDL